MTARIMITTAILLLICGFQFAAANQLTCSSCGEPIEDATWVTVDDKVYHQDHFVCDNCGKSLVNTQFYLKDDKLYDSACYIIVFDSRCSYCGEPITGRYLFDDTAKYHPDCYNDHVALRCSLCNGIIEDRYLLDYRGNVYHLEHKEEASRCVYCRTFISAGSSGGGEQYIDGRIVCGLCLRSAVTDVSVAQSLMKETSRTLGLYGIDIDTDDIPLLLVSKTALDSLSDNLHADQAGFTWRAERKRSIDTNPVVNYKIYALDGMPRAELLSVLAHEAMHVWLFENVSHELDRALTEGSCSYASYLVLNSLDDIEAQYVLRRMLEYEDPIYGEGLRRTKAFVDEQGIAGWLNYLKNNEKAPW